MNYLTQISTYLLITSSFFFTYPECVKELKKAMKDYLSMKQSYQQHRDNYASKSDQKEVKVNQYKEKQHM